MRDWEVWDKDRTEKYIINYGTPQHPDPDHEKRMKVATSLIEGTSLLDVGCGIGHLYPFIKDKVEHYVGIDNSLEMLYKARQFFPVVPFLFGDVYDLSNRGMFDTVVCQSLLLHLPSSIKPITEMWKHVKKALVLGVQLSPIFQLKKTPYKKGYLIIRREPLENLQNILTNLEGVGNITYSFVRGLPDIYVKVTR